METVAEVVGARVAGIVVGKGKEVAARVPSYPGPQTRAAGGKTLFYAQPLHD